MKNASARLIALGFAASCAFLPACSSTDSRATADADWTSPKRDFGRLVIVREMRGVAPADTVERKTVEVREASDAAFAGLPGTEIVDESSLREALADPAMSWGQVSDYEAVLAGRKAGVDTICLMTMNDYGGSLSIGLLPLPGFGTWTYAGYRVRMIDVKTGRLIVDTRRLRSTGGWLCIRKPAGARTDFEADLSDLLAEK